MLETPLSWVLVAGARAYKIKRPVRLPFVDQSALAQRLLLCCEELRLNRRFSPQLYLEVAAITADDSRARIGGAGRPIDYAVVMRAFDAGDELDRLVAGRHATPAELGEFGRWLAHAQAELPSRTGAAAADPARHPAIAAARNAGECLAAAAAFGTEPQVAAIAGQLAREFHRREADLARRAMGGHIRECHADLHLSNIVRLDGRLVPFDCLEFDAALRWIDVAEDVAFLHMDLVAYGAPELAAAFLNGWLQASGDYDACRLLCAYGADRALVRAKVMALRGATAQVRERHEHYLHIAANTLQAPRPRCVMMCGLPGSGKSWLAARLAEARPAVIVSSDVEHRRCGARYDEHGKAAVYARLAVCATAVLDGRLEVIVDANFGRRTQRAHLAALCRARGVPLTVVQCQAPVQVLRERIAARVAAAQDPSEADLRVLQLQQDSREPIAPDEGLTVIDADTTRVDVVDGVLAGIQAND